MSDVQQPAFLSAEQAEANIAALFARKPDNENTATAHEAEANKINVGTEFPHFLNAGTSQSLSSDFIVPPENGDVLAELPISLLVDFPKDKHPFLPYTAEEMRDLKDDITQHGVLQPPLVRKHPTIQGHYEIIAGHNRRTAASELGYKTLSCVIRRLDDDEALLQMISSNLKQRTSLMPSEKAWAYKYQLDALKRQGRRTDLTSCQVGTKLTDPTCGQLDHKLSGNRADEQMAESMEESARTIQRYIRLTFLIPELLEKVDEGKLGLTVGETLSYISPAGQRIVDNFFYSEHSIPITQAIADRLRKMDADGQLTDDGELERAFLSPLVVKQMKSVKVPLKKWRNRIDPKATEKQVVDMCESAVDVFLDCRDEYFDAAADSQAVVDAIKEAMEAHFKRKEGTQRE